MHKIVCHQRGISPKSCDIHTYITWHDITLHYITLHYITLHYIHRTWCAKSYVTRGAYILSHQNQLCPFDKHLLNFIVILLKWTAECFKTDCGQIWWIELSFFKNIFWKNILNFIAILKNDWVFETDCEHNLSIEISLLKRPNNCIISMCYTNNF